MIKHIVKSFDLLVKLMDAANILQVPYEVTKTYIDKKRGDGSVDGVAQYTITIHSNENETRELQESIWDGMR